MGTAEAIRRLINEGERHARQHPTKRATLFVSPTAFRGSTVPLWRDEGWEITEDQNAAISSGDEARAATEFKALLSRAGIAADIQFVAGADIVEIRPGR